MAPPPESLRVLFIGNSFTARNDVPGAIVRLATARGRRLEHRLISAGGASLRMHWNKGLAPQAIAAGGWDYVVLQEQSTLPLKNAQRFHENVRLFDPPIRAAGARTALYLTWARRNAPPDAQDKLTAAYASIAREIGALLVPVGLAWQRLLRARDQPVLHDKDQSHPTPAGSYLAACVFYGVLFADHPAGFEPPPGGLTPAEAAILHRVSIETVAQAAA